MKVIQESIIFIIYDDVAKPLHSLCSSLVTCKNDGVSNTSYSIAAGGFPDMGGNVLKEFQSE